MEGVRGFSALLVFFVHFYAQFGTRAQGTFAYDVTSFMGTLGHCGVDVFFALSGFIIYGLLLKKPAGYLDFVRRRIVRLYPAFTAVFALYVLLSLALPSYSKLPKSPFPALEYLAANFLMLPGFFPIVPMITVAWSLSYELCFYLALPILMWGLRFYAWAQPLRIVWWVAICGVCLKLTTAGLFPHGRMIMFGCGILLRETIAWRIAWTRFGQWFALAAFLATLALAGHIGVPIFTHVILLPGDILAPLFVSTYALGYFALSGEGWLSKGLSWDWLRWVGNMSYSYYLIHGLVLHFLGKTVELLRVPAHLSPVAFSGLWLASIASTLVGGSILFLAIEKPFLLRASRQGRKIAAPAGVSSLAQSPVAESLVAESPVMQSLLKTQANRHAEPPSAGTPGMFY